MCCNVSQSQETDPVRLSQYNDARVKYRRVQVPRWDILERRSGRTKMNVYCKARVEVDMMHATSTSSMYVQDYWSNTEKLPVALIQAQMN